MDKPKDDAFYLNKILTDIDFILAHTQGLEMAELEDNEILLDSVMFRFIQISENSQLLSEAYLDKTKVLPWKKLKSMRNRIVHAYSIVRLDIVYNTIKKDLPAFRIQIIKSMQNS